MKQQTLMDEEIEKAQRKAELDQRIAHRMSKVAKMLTANYYITDWTHPALEVKQNPSTQLSVSEYYPELKIAVDKFYFEEHMNKAHIELKKQALKKMGIKYGYLCPTKSLSDLYVDLELTS